MTVNQLENELEMAQSQLTLANLVNWKFKWNITILSLKFLF